ncbi:MAG: hypothetical protein K2X09_08200 [Rickettsiales bacterium]|nr:hypothetical protein [Rickettsiales bacterium]
MHKRAHFQSRSARAVLTGLTEGTKSALQGAILLEGEDGGGQLYVPIAKASFALKALQKNFHSSFVRSNVTVRSRSKGEDVNLALIELPEYVAPSIKDGIETDKIKFASTHPINDNVDDQLSNIIDKRARHKG